MPDRPVAILAADALAPAIEAILDAEGIAHAAPAPDALADGIANGVFTAAVLQAGRIGAETEEALGKAVAEQPPWSDFPFILLTERGDAEGLRGTVETLGNVTLVEFPLDGAVLANAAHAAIRSGRRQRAAEAYFMQAEGAERSLTTMKATLEARVRARTDDLRTANEKLLKEIDERRAAEERLRESEELYRHALEFTRQQVWTADPEGRILSASRHMSAMEGEVDATITSGWIDVIHPADRADLTAAQKDAFRARKPASVEFRMRAPGGEYRYFRVRMAPQLNVAGEVVRWYGSTEDIHEQKLADLARRQAEERYRLAVQATNDAVWDLDLTEGLVHWSDTAGDVLGYPGEKLGTRPIEWWKERVHPEDRQQTTGSLSEVIRKGRSHWSATYRFRTADGDYLSILDRGFVIFNEEGKAVRVVGAMADLTERHRAEEAIRRMQAELIHVSRLSAMGTMASTLAHELNQPLTAVTNFVQGSRRLLETVEDQRAAEVREALASAEAGALRAGQIVRRLRDLVARGRSALRPEELGKLVDDAGTLAFIDAHLLGVEHKVEIEPEARWVEVDRVQIQQVLINLIRNAIQAMQDCERREISIHGRAVSPAMVEVTVADTGRGIAEDVREALFSPFHSTKEEGLGIGLSICRTIIEAHGGKIWAEDRDGGGTLFRFTVPRYEDAPAP